MTHLETHTETHIETHASTQTHQDTQTQRYTDRHKHLSEVYIYPGLLTRVLTKVLTRFWRYLCNRGTLQLPCWEADGDHGLRTLKCPERRIRETSRSLSRLVLR